jgi:hypothetical protein
VSACSAPKAAFEVEITNAARTQFVAGLVKRLPSPQRPLPEDNWAAPEDIAIHAPPLTARHWGRLIKPGQTIIIGPQTGHFPDGVRPVLRIYGGDPTVEEALAVGRADPDRLDIDLWPGRSAYIITTDDKRLVANRKETGR